ncbi:AAA family ATPase [Persephonella sp.]
MKIKVEKITKPKKGNGLWIKESGSDVWFFLPEGQTVIQGKEYQVDVELRRTRENRKYYLVKKIEEVIQAEQKAEEKQNTGQKKKITLKQALGELEKVEKAINKTIIGREEMVRLALITAVSGGNMLMVGGTGIGKTMTAELVASAFSDRVLYNQLNHYKELTNIIGNIDLKKFRETGEVEYRTDRFLNADFHIYDEFFHSKGKLRGALNDYILRRTLTIDDRGVLKGETRAIFLTSNRLEDLQDPKVQAEGGLAIADRIHIVLQVPDPDETVLEKLLTGGGTKEYSFRQPLSSIEVLEKIRQEAEKIPTPKWLVKKIAEFDAALKLKLPEEYRISPRKYITLVEMMKVSAVMDGRNAITLEDARRILPNAVFTLDQDIRKELNDLLKVSTEPIVQFIQKAQKEKDPQKIAQLMVENLGDGANLKDIKQLLNGDGIEALYIRESLPDVEKLIDKIQKKVESITPEDIEKMVEQQVKEIEEDVLNKEIESGLKM